MTRKPPLPIILAGGLGTRVQGILGETPKVLAPIAGRPFITRLVDQLRSAGFTECALATGYRAEEVQRVVLEAFPEVSFTFSIEKELLGTGGAIRMAACAAPSVPRYLVLNGDSFCDVDLTEFIDSHTTNEATASIVSASVPDTSRYGALDIDDDERVIAFKEKQASTGPGWINAGIYALERSVIERIPEGRPVSIEREIFPSLCRHGLFAFQAPEARFIDIGTPESLAAAERFFGE